jgi:hypothetical protein
MPRKKKSKALVLYRAPLPAAIEAPEPQDEDDNIVAEWGRDLLKTLEEIVPDCRVHPEARMSGRWR